MNLIGRGALVLIGMALATACSSFGAVESTPAATEDGGGAGNGDGGGDGGAPPPPASEDCFDGRDDDGNGKADCEEPSCAPYARCVPGPFVLPGWEGYTSLVTSGDCPPELPLGEDAWTTDDAKATCATCGCDAKLDCASDVSIDQSPYAGCNQGTLPFTLTPGVCGTIPTPAGGAAKYWSVPGGAAQSCSVVESGATVVPPAKYQPVRVCSNARLGGGCPADHVCAKRGGAPLCVSRPVAPGAPAEACPSQFPIARFVAPRSTDPNAAFDDKRGCSACSCASTKAGSCTRVLSLFSDNGCGTLGGTVATSACTNVACNGGCDSGRIDVTPVPGTCGASGGAPTGAVELAVPGTQYCCDK